MHGASDPSLRPLAQRRAARTVNVMSSANSRSTTATALVSSILPAWRRYRKVRSQPEQVLRSARRRAAATMVTTGMSYAVPRAFARLHYVMAFDRQRCSELARIAEDVFGDILPDDGDVRVVPSRRTSLGATRVLLSARQVFVLAPEEILDAGPHRQRKVLERVRRNLDQPSWETACANAAAALVELLVARRLLTGRDDAGPLRSAAVALLVPATAGLRSLTHARSRQRLNGRSLRRSWAP